jgi:uncharacterized protein
MTSTRGADINNRATTSSDMHSPMEAQIVLHGFGMNAENAISTLRRHESALRARGIRHAAVFGSVARGEEQPDSDIDIVIEIDPEARITVFDDVGLKEYVAGLFDGPVDVISRQGLKLHVRSAVTADTIDAF